VPVTPDHRFRIGTASTALTSAAAGLLLENSRLKLGDDIQTYVPAFAKEKQPVTLRQLMGHTRGVTPDDGDEAPLFTQHCERPVEAVQHFRNWLYFEPGIRERYSILRLDPGERGHRGRRRSAVPRVHARARLRSIGDARHRR